MSHDERGLALVTGGASGLGLALSRHLLLAGFDVLACGRTESWLEDARRELPTLRVFRADVTDPADCDRLFEEIRRIGKPLDLLVNNAGVSFPCDYTSETTLSRDRARSEIEVNLAAPIELTRRFLWMRRQQGWDDRPATIANIGTPGAFFPLEPNPLYSATKAGLHMFTLGLRRQLRDSQVTVVENFPPLLHTGLTPGHRIPGEERFGAKAIDDWARISVEGILAGEPNVYPEVGTDFIPHLIETAESVADEINRRVGRNEDWEETVKQRLP